MSNFLPIAQICLGYKAASRNPPAPLRFLHFSRSRARNSQSARWHPLARLAHMARGCRNLIVLYSYKPHFRCHFGIQPHQVGERHRGTFFPVSPRYQVRKNIATGGVFGKLFPKGFLPAILPAVFRDFTYSARFAHRECAAATWPPRGNTLCFQIDVEHGMHCTLACSWLGAGGLRGVALYSK